MDDYHGLVELLFYFGHAVAVITLTVTGAFQGLCDRRLSVVCYDVDQSLVVVLVPLQFRLASGAASPFYSE